MTASSTAEHAVTEAELEVIRMLADGLTVSQVATRLNVTPQAVSMRLARAALALDTRTTTQTVVECVRRGLLGPDTHRAAKVRAELAARHTSTCALLTVPVCDCRHTTNLNQNGSAR